MKRAQSISLLTLLTGLALPAAAQVSAERFEIGASSAGVPIELYAIGEAAPDSIGRTRDQRPAILLIAGIDGTHRVGSRVATALVQSLQQDHAELLTNRTVYVIPRLNPDGFAWLEGSPAMQTGRTRVEVDADGDRRTAEDGADDLNGDGRITMMRVANPAASTGLTAEWIVDENEPRLMRKADRAEGESPEYALLIEGIDNDGDGNFNEDGPGGSAGGGHNLDANFPSFWPEHREDAGQYPLDQPEARALATWIQDYPNITAVVVFNSNDNLLNIPKTGKYDENGTLPKGLEKADEAYHKHVAEAFKEATGMTGAASRGNEGSVASWAYSDLGLWTFETPVWTRPDQVKAEDEEAAEEEAATEEAPADEPEQEAEPEVDEYEELIDRGVPEEFARFLTMTPEEQQVAAAGYQSMSPEEQQAKMEDVAALPEDVRARLMAMAMGGEDPGRPESEGDSKGDKKKDDKPKADEGELAWLKYSDEERGGEGFVDWVAVDHPQLGTVEVGGFVPGFRVNPPEGELERLTGEQTAFLGELLGMLPDLEIGAVETESLGGGLHRVSLSVSNPNYLPTAAAIGIKARRIVPIVAAISVPIADVIAGNRVQSVEQIAGSGGSHTFEWTVRGDDAAAITVEIRSGHYSNHTASQGGDQ